MIVCQVNKGGLRWLFLAVNLTVSGTGFSFVLHTEPTALPLGSSNEKELWGNLVAPRKSTKVHGDKECNAWNLGWQKTSKCSSY